MKLLPFLMASLLMPFRGKRKMLLNWKSHMTVVLIISTLTGVEANLALAGTIRGRVTLAGSFPFDEYQKAVQVHGKVDMKMLMMKAKMEAQGKKMEMEHCHDCTWLVRSLVVAPARGLANAVVALKGVKQKASPPSTHPVSVQRGATFIPRVMAMVKGTVIDFINEDPFQHGIRSKSQASRFNLALPRRGIKATVDFPRTGVVEMTCKFREHMRGYVVVMDHSLFAVTNQRGEFVIQNVPPGTYTLQAWHERLGSMEREITVSASATPVNVQLQCPASWPPRLKRWWPPPTR